MTTNDPKREPGYRGALPTRDDRLARPWILIVFVIFVSIFILSALEIPTRFASEATPLPVPSFSEPPSPSASPEASDSGSPEASGSGSPEATESASPSPTEAP
jgi:hypothetical protein